MVLRKFCVLAFLIFFAEALAIEQLLDKEAAQRIVIEQMHDDRDDSFDFDRITEQMIEVGLDQIIDSKPPSTVMVWLRELGMPLIMKLADIYQKFSEFWHHAKQ